MPPTPTLEVAAGLYTWTLTLEGGATRTVTASTIAGAVGALPVTSAVRGPAFNLSGESVTPTAASLNPTSAKIGDASFTLHVIGTGFRTGCQIVWNGGLEPTTVVSPTEVTTTVNMATATTPTAIPVAVRSLMGLQSNALTFNLLPASGAEDAPASDPPALF